MSRIFVEMEEDYYELTSEVDAREVLRYLNHLGIHNISGEALKYFITDLKKLIKYDLQKRYQLKEQEDRRSGPERLHSATTFCSRIRSKTSGEVVKCSREAGGYPRRPLKVRNIHSAPVLGQTHAEEDDKSVRRSCSCNAVEKRSVATSRESKPVSTLSNNLIKVPRVPQKKKCDPVSLYHYYTSLWTKYKSNVPGENDWSELRWTIRQKMAGCMEVQSQHRVEIHPVKGKESAHTCK